MNASFSKNALCIALLASSVFVTQSAFAVLAATGAVNTDCATIGCASGVNFDNDVTLTVENGTTLGDTVGESAINTIAGPAVGGTLDFAGTSNVTGTIGSTAGAGTAILSAININGGTVTLNDDWAATDTTVAAGGTLSAAGTKNITGNLTVNNNGVLNAQGNTLTVAGGNTFQMDAGSTLAVTVANNGASSGGVVNTAIGSTTTINASAVQVTLSGGTIPDGTKLLLINGVAGGAAVTVPATVTGGTLGYTLTLSTDNEDLFLTINTVPLSTAVSSAIGASSSLAYLTELVNTLTGLSGTTDPAMSALLGTLAAQTDADTLARAISTLAPISDGSLMTASLNNVQRGIHTVQDRMEKVRLGYVMPKGTYSAGDWDTGVGGWVQVFGSDITQKARGGFDGYDAWNAGFAVGFDQEIMKCLLVGAGFSYAYTDIDSNMFTNNHVAVQTYQGFAYGSWKGYDPLYLDAVLSLAYHDYRTSRYIIIPAAGGNPGINRRAEGDYNGWQFGFWTELGYEWLYNNWLFTPHVNFKYSHLNPQSLQEKGAGPYNLMVDYETVEEAVLGGGLRVGYIAELSNGMEMMPYIYGQVFHDFINDRQQSVSNFVGGGTTFGVPGFEPPATSYRLGAGIDLASEDNWYLSINYDYNFKNDYHAHGGFLKFRYEWA